MIIALISVYQPTENVIKNVDGILKQVDKVFICDNSNKHNGHMFEIAPNLVYIFNGRNLGLSSAFNQVLKDGELYDISDDDFVFFFDQDSSITGKHVNVLVEKYRKLESEGFDVGCLGPVFFNTNRAEVEIQHAKKQLDNDTYSVKSIITSSMVCRYGKLKKIGFWNEEIFLDMADWDLCWRFIQQKYLCCVTTATVLNHTLGEGEKKIVNVKLRIGKTFREYYQIRDGLYLLRKSYTPLKFRIRIWVMLTIRSLARLLFLEDRKQRWLFIKKGIHDYRRNVHGEFQEVE